MDTEIRFLDTTPVADIHACFLQAFSDYALPVDMSVRQFMLMLSRRGFEKSFSVGAFSGQQMVGCLLTGINGQSGYVISSGVIKEFRGMGMFTSMFEQLKERMIEDKKQDVILEVLKDNTAAVRLYRRLGFTQTRDLEFYTGSAEVSAGLTPTWQISLCGPGIWIWNCAAASGMLNHPGRTVQRLCMRLLCSYCAQKLSSKGRVWVMHVLTD